jgi:serine phosphatase RsbU (regulator of sigma subunit)
VDSDDTSARLGSVLARLVWRAHLLNPAEVAAVVAEEARALGMTAAVLYLATYGQTHLVPVASPEAADRVPQDLDGSLAGRAYRTITLVSTRGDLPGTRRVWVPLLDGVERLGVIEALVSESGDAPTDEEMLRFAGLVAEVVTSKQNYGDTFEFVRRRRPMTVAAEIQWNVLPPLTYATDSAVLTGALEPSHSVAGDSFDYAINGDTVHLAVFDAMGHGLDAALTSSVAVAAYRNERRAFTDLARTPGAIDEVLARRPGEVSFVTALLSELDLVSGTLSWVSAGHPAPLLLRASRVVKSLDSENRPPLGVLVTETPSVVSHESLEPGDRVLFYTDGVVEARTPDGAFFTVERLGEFVARELSSGLPTPEVLRRVTRQVLQHQGGRLQDDATVVLMEWQGPSSRQILPGTS